MKLFAPLALLAVSVLPARAQGPVGCAPDWQPTFGLFPGVDDPSFFSDRVHALWVHDFGDGPELVVAGYFDRAGDQEARHIARWDGARWASFESGATSSVLALASFDDGWGLGTLLFAAGGFTGIGGHPANRVARWNGTHWGALGTGTNGPVRALEVFDDGGGPALYAGGEFYLAGGLTTGGIARWNGVSWSPVGSGAGGIGIHALAVFDDGAGPALYAGGEFISIGGVAASRLARWDGGAWSPVGGGTQGDVYALEVFDDGGGPALYVGGGFQSAGGVLASHVAKWDGQAWSALGAGTDGEVLSFGVHDDGAGGGPALYVGGGFSQAGGVAAPGIARWDGTAWSPLGAGVSYSVEALTSFDLGPSGGTRLAVGGDLVAAGEFEPAQDLAIWDGAAWSPFGDGLSDRVSSAHVHDDGTGPALYLGGRFSFGQGELLPRVARWDGAALEPLGSGTDDEVLALATFDDGGGAALYAGGAFTSAGGVAANHVARWDGQAWSPLGSGLDGEVHALAVYDDGGGPALYAGGDFTHADGVLARHVARWDGASWSAVGDGTDDTVYALATCEIDGRVALYAGGEFHQAGGQWAYCIASWNGSSWRDVGVGTSDAVRCLLAHDDGSGGGPALYVGGRFKRADQLEVNHVARWDGQAWSALGDGFAWTVEALAAHDDGSGAGPRLHAGGGYLTTGGETDLVARFDGGSWTWLSSGGGAAVLSLASFDDGSGPSLYAGGDFRASGAGDAFLARWGCPAPVGEIYCACDGGGAPAPCGNAGGAGAGCANSSGVGAELVASGSASLAADDLALHASRLLLGQPAQLFVGDAAVAGGDGLPFGDGLRCAGGTVRRLGVETPDAAGRATWGPGLSGPVALPPGSTARFQVWYRDPGASPCAQGFNLSNGYAVELVR